MLQEKTMVNDALADEKNGLTFYANAISECANPQLRSTIQQIRNNCETSQYELFQLAQAKVITSRPSRRTKAISSRFGPSCRADRFRLSFPSKMPAACGGHF